MAGEEDKGPIVYVAFGSIVRPSKDPACQWRLNWGLKLAEGFMDTEAGPHVHSEVPGLFECANTALSMVPFRDDLNPARLW